MSFKNPKFISKWTVILNQHKYLFPNCLCDVAVVFNWLSFLFFRGDLGSDAWRYLTLNHADGGLQDFFKNSWSALLLMSSVRVGHLETSENPSACLHWEDLETFKALALWMGFITSNTSHQKDTCPTEANHLTHVPKGSSAPSEGKAASPRKGPSSGRGRLLHGGYWLFPLTPGAAEIHGLDEMLKF